MLSKVGLVHLITFVNADGYYGWSEFHRLVVTSLYFGTGGTEVHNAHNTSMLQPLEFLAFLASYASWLA